MNLDAEAIASAIGAEVLAEGDAGSPKRATIDSGDARPGDLFFGLRGERVDGGEFAAGGDRGRRLGRRRRPDGEAAV